MTSIDLFGSKEGRLYRTGDLARFMPDGNVDILGRTDDQVKFRRFRIVLGEIESVIMEYAGITETVVVVRLNPGNLMTQTLRQLVSGLKISEPSKKKHGLLGSIKNYSEIKS